MFVSVDRRVNADVLADEGHERFAAGIIGNHSLKMALPLHHADNWCFEFLAAKALRTFRPLAGVLIGFFATYVSFINFNLIFQQLEVASVKDIADTLKHKPSRLLSDS